MMAQVVLAGLGGKIVSNCFLGVLISLGLRGQEEAQTARRSIALAVEHYQSCLGVFVTEEVRL